jgi:RHS repeat-associated protein
MSVSYGDGESQACAFDSMGNRTSKTDSGGTGTGASYTFDAANRLTSVTPTGGSSAAVTFDADGNTLTDASGRTYTWDSENRMTSCTYQGDTTTYTYGYDGLRRSSTKDSVTTNYVYDGDILVAEMRPNASGTLVIVTMFMLGTQGIEAKIDETTQTEAYYELDPTTGNYVLDANNNKIVAYRGVTSWYIYDGHGNVVGIVNGVTGAYTANPTLDVYGIPRETGASATKQGYCGSLGHVTDDTGLVYMRARYYDPSVGRFVSEDPSCNGVNWYVYCRDNPVNLVDSDGQTPSQAWGILWMALGSIGIQIALDMYKCRGFGQAAYVAGLSALAFGVALNELGASTLSQNALIAATAIALTITVYIQNCSNAMQTASGIAGGVAVVAIAAATIEGVACMAIIATIGDDTE